MPKCILSDLMHSLVISFENSALYVNRTNAHLDACASTVAGKVSGKGEFTGLGAAPSFEVSWASVARLQNTTAMRTLTLVAILQITVASYSIYRTLHVNRLSASPCGRKDP